MKKEKNTGSNYISNNTGSCNGGSGRGPEFVLQL